MAHIQHLLVAISLVVPWLLKIATLNIRRTRTTPSPPPPPDGERPIPLEGATSCGCALERESIEVTSNTGATRPASTEETPSRPAPRRQVSSAQILESTIERGNTTSSKQLSMLRLKLWVEERQELINALELQIKSHSLARGRQKTR
jgi:hypothetical protein